MRIETALSLLLMLSISKNTVDFSTAEEVLSEEHTVEIKPYSKAAGPGRR